MITQRIICLVIGYAFGLIQTGYFVGKANHVDIRQHGSGNAGMTNATRVLGAKFGLITFLGDCFKAVVAVTIAWALFHNSCPELVNVLKLYAGLGVVLGHNYPFYLKFKGGKGISSTVGVIFSYDFRMGIICMLLFLVAALPTSYISLGSLVILASFFIQTIIFGQLGWIPVAAAYLPEVYILVAIFTILGFVRHRANIVRLIHGNENKFSIKSKEKRG